MKIPGTGQGHILVTEMTQAYRKVQVLPVTYVCLCAGSYPSRSSVFFVLCGKPQLLVCAKWIYYHSPERWQSSVRVQSLKVNVASLHSALSYLTAIQHKPCIFCAQKNCFMRYRKGAKPRSIYPKPYNTTLSQYENFQWHIWEAPSKENLLYVILKRLAYFASFCCLHKSLLQLHVSCKHVQTMP